MYIYYNYYIIIFINTGINLGNCNRITFIYIITTAIYIIFYNRKILLKKDFKYIYYRLDYLKKLINKLYNGFTI